MTENLSEADTGRKLVVPKLVAAGWDSEPHSIGEPRTAEHNRRSDYSGWKGFVRKAPKRVDYLLHYTRDFPLAVIEAKAAYRTAADGVQQAKQYAEILWLIHRALLGTLQHKRHTPIGLRAGCALSATVHPGICPTDSIQNKPGHSCRELRIDSNG
jgi:hypothetical protein